MKFRTGHVSNSSSSSYIVSVPEHFNINDHIELFINCLYQHDDEGDHIEWPDDWSEGEPITDSMEQEFIAKVKPHYEKFIKLLQDGDAVWHEEYWTYYWGLHDAFEELGMIIGGVDGGPDDGKMQGVPFKELMNKVIKISGGDPNSIMETFNENNSSGK